MYRLGHIVLLKQPYAGNARGAGLEAPTRIGEGHAAQRKDAEKAWIS